MTYRNEYYCPGCDESWDNCSYDRYGEDACPSCMEYAQPYASTLISRLPPLRSLNCSRGAPMGRHSDQGDPDYPHHFIVELLPMVDGDYDVGGAYWGSGNHDIGWMYRAYAKGEEEILDIFLRAKRYDDVVAKLQDEYPNATFERGQ